MGTSKHMMAYAVLNNFNPGKTKDLIFSNKCLFNSPPLIFNGVVVDRVSQHKHLGIWLSSNLDFKKQVHETCIRANGKLAVLRSVKGLSRATLDLLYKLTVRSVIDYGLIVYFHSLRQTEVARLTQVQYRAAKLVTGTLHYTSREKLNTELGWETLSTRAEFLGLTLFQKIHQTRPLIRKFMPKINTKTHNVRSTATACYTPFPRLGKNFSDSFFPHFCISWNKPENDIKSEIDISSFKEKLKDVNAFHED